MAMLPCFAPSKTAFWICMSCDERSISLDSIFSIFSAFSALSAFLCFDDIEPERGVVSGTPWLEGETDPGEEGMASPEDDEDDEEEGEAEPPTEDKLKLKPLSWPPSPFVLGTGPEDDSEEDDSVSSDEEAS